MYPNAHEVVVGEGNNIVGAESFFWCVEQRGGAKDVEEILVASISLTCLFTGGGIFLLCDSSRGVQKVMIEQIRMHLEGEPSFAFIARRLNALVVTAKKEVRESVCLVRIVQERILPFGVLGFIILSSFLTRLLASRCPPVVGLCGNCSISMGTKKDAGPSSSPVVALATLIFLFAGSILERVL